MKRVKEFLHRYWDGSHPLLLGYSGGPDSKALLYALLDFGFRHLHVAHVDHGWREESYDQALEIKEEIETLKLPFSMTCLHMNKEENMEFKARVARLRFFSDVYHAHSCQALLLAHQADDLGETVLKRVLEGAHLCSLSGMAPISVLEGMNVWRPLLSVPKKELMNFLHEKALGYIDDPTNRSLAYLRSRMRVETIPMLEKSFGKNFLDNLCVLSERSLEFKQYLDEKTKHVPLLEALNGKCFCCTGLERLEVRYLIQKMAQALSLVLNRTVLEIFLNEVQKGSSFFLSSVSGGEIALYSGLVFLSKGERISQKALRLFSETVKS